MFGMTPRLPWSGNPRPLWKMYDEFGMENAVMYGFWNKQTPVKTDNSDVPATVYLKDGKAMVVLANWTDQEKNCRLIVDEKGLGFKPSKVSLPDMEGIQTAKIFDWKNSFPVEGNRGLFILLEK